MKFKNYIDESDEKISKFIEQYKKERMGSYATVVAKWIDSLPLSANEKLKLWDALDKTRGGFKYILGSNSWNKDSVGLAKKMPWIKRIDQE